MSTLERGANRPPVSFRNCRGRNLNHALWPIEGRHGNQCGNRIVATEELLAKFYHARIRTHIGDKNDHAHNVGKGRVRLSEQFSHSLKDTTDLSVEIICQ